MITAGAGGVDGIPDHRPAGKQQDSSGEDFSYKLFILYLSSFLLNAARTDGILFLRRFRPPRAAFRLPGEKLGKFSDLTE
jgi:hypothetical protein